MDVKKALARTKKISSGLRIFFLVCFFGICALLVLICALAAFSLSVPEQGIFELGIGWFGLFQMAVCMIPSVAIVWILSRIFADIASEGSPFLRKQSTRIRWIAFFILLDVVLGVAFSPIFIGAVAAGGVELGFGASGNLPTYYLNIDGWEAFLALVLFCLSYAFEYGALLQQESDETL